MGVEVVATEMAQASAEAVADKGILHEKENGKLDQDGPNKEPIKFVSLEEEPAKGEENNAPDVILRKDAADEWPESKKPHFFPFVRYSRYEDPKIKAEILKADKELQKWNGVKRRLFEELKAKRSEKAELISQRRALHDDLEQFRSVLGEKKKEMEPLAKSLSDLRNMNNAGGRVLCSSEEELNDLIYSLQYRIQHESIPLAEEKKLVKEIRQLEATRNKVIENAAKRAEIQESLGPKVADQVKLMGADLDGVRKDQQATWNQIKQIKDKRTSLDGKIDSLDKELKVAMEKSDNAYNSIKELKKQQEQKNRLFYESLGLLKKAKELAANRDKIAIEELSHAEMEKFMSLWCGSKTFRDDYEKRILPSLDRRQFGRDGRIRNPEEKPLIATETQVPPETEMVAKASIKEPKENKSSLKENKSSTQKDTLPASKDQKATSNKATDTKSATDNSMAVDEEMQVSDKSEKQHNAHEEVDKEKLKEMKREEEIAKAKQAMERKKKLAEKAAAKAAVKAQKEAEKKLKEREKRAKKKAAASATGNDLEESTEPLTESTEPEMVDVNAEAPTATPILMKDKVQKEKTIRQRSRVKGPDSLPRAILKRKKSNNYWVWAAAAAFVVLMLLVFAYYYLL